MEEELLRQVAEILKVPAEAIKNFDSESVNNFFNTFQDQSTGAFNNYNCTFNPIDKWVEALEENKKLYERLLESEKEKVELLKKMMGK